MIEWKKIPLILRHMSWLMTAAVLALLSIGILFIYSATSASDSPVAQSLWRQQVVWAVAGVFCYFGFAILDYRRLRRIAWWTYSGAIVLLIAVLLLGPKIYGARRWLMIGSFNLQPSEIAKLGLVFILARKLSRPGENLGHFRPLVAVLAIAAVPFLLIMKEPDLGTALVLLPAAGAMMFVAGVPVRSLALLVLMALLFAGSLVAMVVVPAKLGWSDEKQNHMLAKIGINPYQKSRIEVFIGLDSDPFGAGWNKRQSEISVGSGGLKGKGFQKGTQNILGYLPRSVAPTDFIFAVIAEEMGFLGSAVVLTLFGVVVAVSFVAALSSHDKMGRLLCVGLVSILTAHVVINMAMTVGLMPVTGLPLPLLSYGGSFMLITMAALGMIQSVYARSHEAPMVFEQTGLWTAG